MNYVLNKYYKTVTYHNANVYSNLLEYIEMNK